MLLIILTLFLNLDLQSKEVEQKNFCKINHFVRQKCIQNCMFDPEKAENFKQGCLSLDGRWSFITNTGGHIKGFQCELKKLEFVQINKKEQSNKIKCADLNIGDSTKELQLVSTKALKVPDSHW